MTVATFSVAVQPEDFDVAALQHALLAGEQEEGAVATFTGYVRRQHGNDQISQMLLEHYPGMTEKAIGAVLDEAHTRWPLSAASVVHRIGSLSPGDRIVWVGVAAHHREAAFCACEFIMDYLKTRAPFWKKEASTAGDRWVEARVSDDQRAGRWHDST